MARLRVRIELNRRMVGVPLDKMASVVEETHKFFHLLSEDVKIQADRGEWLASEFDAESLNFTAEYAGAVSTEQAHAFGAAFAGATSLRKSTIAQFTRIADFLGEDELVGFGLYQSDQETEPSEWRCLSKRDAMRFGEEIQMLAKAAGEHVSETQLPTVMRGSVAGRRLFKERRAREVPAADPSKVVRELESNLSRRIGLLEDEVAEQNRRMLQIGGNPDAAEEKFHRLLAAMETFWAQAPRQLPQLASPVALPVEEAQPVPAPLAAPQQSRGWSVMGVSVAAAVAILIGLAFPELQHQWVRFASVQILPTVKPKTPTAPVLPIPTPAGLPQAESPTPAASAVHTVAARSHEPFVGPLIPLDIPSNLKTKIQSEARVQVVVEIDQEGKVTDARVSSTTGNNAPLLAPEALRAARQSHFRPAREGQTTIDSQMVLSYQFKPDSDEF
jgi:TonB family protein